MSKNVLISELANQMGITSEALRDFASRQPVRLFKVSMGPKRRWWAVSEEDAEELYSLRRAQGLKVEPDLKEEEDPGEPVLEETISIYHKCGHTRPRFFRGFAKERTAWIRRMEKKDCPHCRDRAEARWPGRSRAFRDIR